jgi:hypothetical protein
MVEVEEELGVGVSGELSNFKETTSNKAGEDDLLYIVGCSGSD